MKSKNFTILIIFFLLFPTLNVVAEINIPSNDSRYFEFDDIFNFTNLEYENDNQYISVNINESELFLMSPGKPVLPVFTKTYKFPIGTVISDVKVSASNIKIKALTGKIKPSPPPIIQNDEYRKIYEKSVFEDEKTYSSFNFYPSDWFDYRIGRGIEDGDFMIFLTIHFFPVRYIPAKNRIYFASDFSLNISYKKSDYSDINTKEYDMVVITPRKFSFQLLELVRHKNKIGISTFIKNTEKIYADYEGRDKPEQIKYFIKDAVETYGVKYVLLVGGLKNQRDEWYIPIRRTSNDDGWETGYISDLYYSDIYNSIGEFSSWDTNENDIFAEWYYNEEKRDIIDYYPDVYVGRLACRNKIEVETVIDKIIDYENRLKWRPWNKQMIIVGGDTFPAPNSTYYEGEIETNKSSSYLESAGYKIIKLWASEGTLRGYKFAGVTLAHRSIIKAIEKGAAFIHFAGHGNPFYWGTHPPQEYSNWIDGIRNIQMENLNNRNKLPVVIVGGCHNSQFNVTLLNMLKGIKNEGIGFFNYSFWLMDWTPRCWSWKLVGIRNGGAIATVGNTGLGYGYAGDYTLNGLSGWIEPRFFYNIGIQGRTMLGEVHSKTISDYIDNFDVNNDRIDRKTIEQWVLLGDPSLNIG